MFDARFSLSLYVLGSLVFFLDLIDVLVRLYLRREQTVASATHHVAPTSVPLDIGDFTLYEARLHLRPYAILAAVHNAADRLDPFLNAMRPFRDRLWIIDDASTDDTWSRLQQSGVRCFRNDSNRQKPASIRSLLASLPPDVTTVVVLDPDARILTDRPELEQILFEFQRSAMAAFCPRLAVKPQGWLTRLQRLEYWFAFSLGRKALGDFCITSGIAVYEREALRRVFETHSLSVYAEDLENALILLLHGERVYYDGRLVVEVEAPNNLRQLFSQRVGWHFGLLKVYLEHCRALVGSTRGFGFTYQYAIYMGLFVLLFHPLKILGLGLLCVSAINGVDNVLGLDLVPDTTVTNSLYFAAVYLKYTALTLVLVPLVVGKGERRSLLLVVPVYVIYAIAQIAPATVGYLNWFAIRLSGRRVYRDHYQPAAP